MNGRFYELVAAPWRAARRASVVWGLSLGALIALTVAFYPPFRDEAELSDLIEGMPDALIQAFGLADFGTPAGFLRGNLYAVLVPLLVAVAGVLLMNGQTASDEDAGRMEAYVAQPVSRAAVFTGRVVAVSAWLVAIGIVMVGIQIVADGVFGLDIGIDKVVATVSLCVLLGLLHAGVAGAIAGATGRPGLVLAAGMTLAMAGYVAVALFPISEALAPWRHASPWDWALGGDPLQNGIEAWRVVALAGPAAALFALGAWAFGRRDVRAA